MATWFECKVKYDKIDERSGKEKTVTEPYLVDAVSFTEAEERIHRQVEEFISGEFAVSNINRTKIEEIHAYEADGWWYKCKVAFVDADEKSGKEKKTLSEILVNADNMIQACERLTECLKTVIVPYTVKMIQETALVDIFPYFDDEEDKNDEDIPEHLKPVEKKDDTYIGDNDIDENYSEED